MQPASSCYCIIGWIKPGSHHLRHVNYILDQLIDAILSKAASLFDFAQALCSEAWVLRIILWTNLPYLPSGKQAGRKRYRDQASAAWRNMQLVGVSWPYNRTVEDVRFFQLDLRHVKSHLWLFVNCPWAELWKAQLGKPTGKAHYSHQEVTKAWSKIPPSALRQRNRWRSRWAMWALMSRYVMLLYHVRALGDLQDASPGKNSGNRKRVRN